MSAIRHNNRRAASRSTQLPYARPAAKKSSWSLTGFLSYLNPLRSRTAVDSTESDSSSDSSEESSNRQLPPAAESLSTRGHQMANVVSAHSRQNTFAGPSTPQPPPMELNLQTPISFVPPRRDAFSVVPESSPAKNLETVSTFLSERAGKPMSDVEIEGLISLIHKSTPPDKPEPFRFSSSTPSTPARENSPFTSNINGDNFGFTPTQSAAPPRRTLSKNPNGVYRWEGGGSAKSTRSRNRYSSPAFGPSRSTSSRLVLKESQAMGEVPKADTKRRRVGNETESSFAPSGMSANGVNGNTTTLPHRSAAPDPSPTRIAQALPFPVTSGSPAACTPNGATASKLGGLSSAPRPRIPALLQKPTVPVIPSPLRQTWSGGSSFSQSDSPPQTQARQTKAANFMTELIKEVTPPKRPDLSNPYQAASPVGKVSTVKSKAGKRARATGRPAAPGAKDEKSKPKEANIATDKDTQTPEEYSPQAIIEATLPKGSKRSRPPAHFEKSTPSVSESSSSPPDLNMSSHISPPLGNKRQLPNTEETNKSFSYIVEEVEDQDEEETKRATKRSKPFVNGRGSPSVKRLPGVTIEEVDDIDMQSLPEKVKVVKPAAVTNSGTPSPTPPPPLAPSPSMTAGRPIFGGFKTNSAPKEPSKLRFSYQPELGSSSSTPTPQRASPAQDSASLPQALVTVRESLDVKDDVVRESKRAQMNPKEAALAMPVNSLPTFTFSVVTTSDTLQYLKARDQAKLLSKSSLPSFDFGVPTLKNEVSNLVPSKATAVAEAPPVKAFDWAAAGMKPVRDSSAGAWTCPTCMLSNPATAVDKCTICGDSR